MPTTLRDTADTAWLRRFHPAPDAPVRLFCLPHAGGSASYYFPVSAALSPRVDVQTVQYPGRQDRHREPLVPDIATMADRIAEVIAGRADRPFAIFGHSMGGALAFEVALRLERDGIVASQLFVSGRRAPSTVRVERTHLLPDDELVSELLALSGTDGAVFGDPELVAMVLPALRSDLRAIEMYQGGDERICSPIHALVGRTDTKASVAEVEQWSGHTSAGCETHVYSGGHFYLGRHARDVIALIDGHLAAAAGSRWVA